MESSAQFNHGVGKAGFIITLSCRKVGIGIAGRRWTGKDLLVCIYEELFAVLPGVTLVFRECIPPLNGSTIRGTFTEEINHIPNELFS